MWGEDLILPSPPIFWPWVFQEVTGGITRGPQNRDQHVKDPSGRGVLGKKESYSEVAHFFVDPKIEKYLWKISFRIEHIIINYYMCVKI